MDTYICTFKLTSFQKLMRGGVSIHTTAVLVDQLADLTVVRAEKMIRKTQP